MTQSAFNPRRLTLARCRRGMTLAGLAQTVGLDRRSITAYEGGEFAPDPARLSRLARTLDLPEAFFADADPVALAVDSASFAALRADRKDPEELIAGVRLHAARSMN